MAVACGNHGCIMNGGEYFNPLKTIVAFWLYPIIHVPGSLLCCLKTVEHALRWLQPSQKVLVTFVSASVAGALCMVTRKQVVHNAKILSSSRLESHNNCTNPELLKTISNNQQL